MAEFPPAIYMANTNDPPVAADVAASPSSHKLCTTASAV
jgi:hypothetical protein